MAKLPKAKGKVKSKQKAKTTGKKSNRKAGDVFDLDQMGQGIWAGLSSEWGRTMTGRGGSGTQAQTNALTSFNKGLARSFNKWKSKNPNQWDAASTAIEEGKKGQSTSYITGAVVGNYAKSQIGNVAHKSLDFATKTFLPQFGKSAISSAIGKAAGPVGTVMTAHDLGKAYIDSKQGQKFLRQQFGTQVASDQVGTGGSSTWVSQRPDEDYLYKARLQYANDMEKEGTYFAHKGTDDEKVQAVIDAYDDDKYGVELSEHNKALNKSSRDHIQGMADNFKQEDIKDHQVHIAQKFGISNPFGASQYDNSQGGVKDTWESDIDATNLNDDFKQMVKQDVNRQTAKRFAGKKIADYGNLYVDTDNDRSNDQVHTYNAKSFQHNKLRGSTESNPGYYWSGGPNVYETPHTDHELTVRQAQAKPDGSPGGKDKLIDSDYRETHSGHHKSYSFKANRGKWKGKNYFSGRNIDPSMEDSYYIKAAEGSVLRGDYNKARNEMAQQSWLKAVGQGGLDAKPAGHTYEDYHW